VIAQDKPTGPAVVTIANSDTGFTSSNCGSWTADLTAITKSSTGPFGPGTYIVRADVAPGTWRADGGSSCSWARLRGFGGTAGEIIASGDGASATARIESSDRGFLSTGCGTWKKTS
jgi:hypothetical protein